MLLPGPLQTLVMKSISSTASKSARAWLRHGNGDGDGDGDGDGNATPGV